MFIGWSAGVMSTGSDASDLLISSAHLLSCSSCLVSVCLCLSVNGLSVVKYFLVSFFVVSYNSFMFLCTAAVSASLARFSVDILLSFLTLFFTYCLPVCIVSLPWPLLILFFSPKHPVVIWISTDMVNLVPCTLWWPCAPSCVERLFPWLQAHGLLFSVLSFWCWSHPTIEWILSCFAWRLHAIAWHKRCPLSLVLHRL